MPDSSGDIEITIQMRDQVLAGNHTLYLRVTEEVSEGDPRYFDLPLEIQVEEELKPGRIFVERVTELTPFLPGSEQSYEFRVENQNNIPLEVVITSLTLPSGWTASFSTSGSSLEGNLVKLVIDPFSTDEFTLILKAPGDVVAGKDAVVILSVTPFDEEVSTSQLIQTPQFKFTTTCEGIDCVVNAALDFESPQTIGLYVGILLVIFLAVYRRGQTSAREVSMWEEEESNFEKLNDEFGDLPEAISDEELDDDLELLEDLEEL